MAGMLLCDQIEEKISSTLFSNILCFDSVGSTNTVALEKAVQNPSDEFVVLSDAQTGGKGRHGRTWFSPPGKNIYMSLLLRPYIDIRLASSLTILSAISLYEAMRDISGLEIRIKWPNDLVINGKKLAGILTETVVEHSCVSVAAVGIGLNVSLSGNDFPQDLRGKASSLFMETERSFDREEIVVKILERFSSRYRKLYVPTANAPMRTINRDERSYLTDLWKSLDTVLGHNISVTTSKGTLTGKAVDIDDAGMLDLLRDDGTIEKIHTGDIILL